MKFKIILLNIKYKIFNKLKWFVDKHASWGYVYDSFYGMSKQTFIKSRSLNFKKVISQYAIPYYYFDHIGMPCELLKSNIHNELYHQITELARKSVRLEVFDENDMKIFRATAYLGEIE